MIHLSIAERRTDGLRGQRRVVDPDLHESHRIVAGLQHLRIRVAHAKHADAVENSLCAAVPERIAVGRRVDHGRSIAWLGAPAVEAVDVEHLVGNRDGDVLVRARHRSQEPAQLHALRRDDVVIVAKDLRAPRSRIRQLVQWEVRGAQLMVDPKVDGQIGIVRPARVGLIDGTRVGAGAEVARAAGLDTVAAHLHVPEQGFAQSDGRAPISHIGGKSGNAPGTQGFEGSRPRVAVREQLLRARAGPFADDLRAHRQTAKARRQHQNADHYLAESLTSHEPPLSQANSDQALHPLAEDSLLAARLRIAYVRMLAMNVRNARTCSTSTSS